MRQWSVLVGRSSRNRGDAFIRVDDKFVGVVYRNNPVGDAYDVAMRIANGFSMAELLELQRTCVHEWDIGEMAALRFEVEGGPIEWHCIHCHKRSDK